MSSVACFLLTQIIIFKFQANNFNANQAAPNGSNLMCVQNDTADDFSTRQSTESFLYSRVSILDFLKISFIRIEALSRSISNDVTLIKSEIEILCMLLVKF